MRGRERNVELVGLGLPLQGSGWTENSMHMWRRVCEGRHCVRVAPPNLIKKKLIVHVFDHIPWSVINGTIKISEMQCLINLKTTQLYWREGRELCMPMKEIKRNYVSSTFIHLIWNLVFLPLLRKIRQNLGGVGGEKEMTCVWAKGYIE